MKTLYLMRHGQTLFNKQHKVQGWCDSPLTELGREQAKIAGAYFRDNHIQFDHAYSSTSERASDTLELVTDMPYVRVKNLKEWNFGAFEGKDKVLESCFTIWRFLCALWRRGRERISKSCSRLHFFYYGERGA